MRATVMVFASFSYTSASAYVPKEATQNQTHARTKTYVCLRRTNTKQRKARSSRLSCRSARNKRTRSLAPKNKLTVEACRRTLVRFVRRGRSPLRHYIYILTRRLQRSECETQSRASRPAGRPDARPNLVGSAGQRGSLVFFI